MDPDPLLRIKPAEGNLIHKYLEKDKVGQLDLKPRGGGQKKDPILFS